jgi:hypothetical protein
VVEEGVVAKAAEEDETDAEEGAEGETDAGN